MGVAASGSAQRMLRFAIVGTGAAALFFVLLYVFALLGAPPFPGSVVAYAIAFAVAYTAQHGWTFGGVHDHGRTFPRYLTAQLACALVAGGVGHMTVNILAFSPFWMSAGVTLVASAASYVLSSLWVFPAARTPGP